MAVETRLIVSLLRMLLFKLLLLFPEFFPVLAEEFFLIR